MNNQICTKVRGLLLLAGLSGILATRLTAAPATFNVDSTADTADPAIGDSICGPSGGPCTLRAAIEEANFDADTDTINFSIPGSGPHTIAPAFPGLPTITTPVIIDGYTQGQSTAGTTADDAKKNTLLIGSDAVLKIELSGENAGNPSNAGLDIRTGGGGSIIRGLVINRFNSAGISINVNNVTVTGCYIGTDVSGTAALGNQLGGILVNRNSAANAGNSQIGGTTPDTRNLISGNASAGIVLNGDQPDVITGNYIGVDKTGNAALGNGTTGIVLGTLGAASLAGTSIGGTTARPGTGAGNLISGNGGPGGGLGGIVITPSGNTNVGAVTIAGNIIGLNATGTVAIPNNGHGILNTQDPGASTRAVTTIGGTVAEARNVISGNTGSGIVDSTDNTVVQGNLIGTDITGTLDLGNGTNGILSFGEAGFAGSGGGRSITIGGSTGTTRNVISGNGFNGIDINASTATIQGNFIGTTVNGTSALGNGDNGIRIQASPGDSIATIGGASAAQGNTIGFNEQGIEVRDTSTARIQNNTIFSHRFRGVVVLFDNARAAILQNAIFNNGTAAAGDPNLSLGIDLDGTGGVTGNDTNDPDIGPNNLQNFPVITSVSSGSTTTIQGSLNSLANTQFRIEFFANAACSPTGNGEGATFLGFANVTTGPANGNVANMAPINVTLPVPMPPGYLVVTATATRLDGTGNPVETSEFSSCKNAGGGACSTVVTNTNDGGPGSLRAAIDCANSTPGAQTITLPAGTYTLSRSGAGEDANATGDLDITNDLTITGAGAATTIIDGNSLDRVFDVISAAQGGSVNPNLLTKVTISGVTVRNGRAVGDGGGIRSKGILTLNNDTLSNNAAVSPAGGGDANGGGVAAISAGSLSTAATTLSISGCTISGNTAADSGGGAYGAASSGGDTLLATNSTFSGNTAGGYGGGGVADGGPLSMTNCTISNNQSGTGAEGGGFACQGSDATLTDCTFSNNTSGDEGGGFANEGGDLVLIRCTFNNNTSNDSGGGGFVNAGGDLVMTDCTVSGNTSRSISGDNDGGGGFENEGGDLVMTRCVVSNNTVTDTGGNGQGGGGFENEGGSLDMTDCTISGNTSEGLGGGIHNEGGAISLIRCTVSGNTTQEDGGGINNEGGDLDMTNCTISGNTATGEGGGIADVDGGTLLNVTIANNSATSGGGIYQEDGGGNNLIFKNTIITNGAGGTNTLQFSSATYSVNESGSTATITVTRTTGTSGGGLGGNFVVGSSPTPRVQSLGSNISSDNTLAAFFNQPGDLNNTDPKLAPLAANGGLTRTHALLSGSPAIDAGINTGAPATDQRGVARPIDGDGNGSAIVDIGAFETSPLPPPGVLSVGFATANGTATAAQDYTATSGTLNFAANDTSKTFTVPITDDALVEGNETVNLTLSTPTGGASIGTRGTAVLTIVDDDSAANNGTLQFSSTTYRINEGRATATITVTRTGGSSGAVAVSFATSNGTATAGQDYTTRTGTLTWADGDTTAKTFTVPIINDVLDEPNERVNLTLSNPTGGATIGTPGTAALVIVDNDVSGCASAITLGITRGTLRPVPYLPGLFRPSTRFVQTLTLRNTTGRAITGPISLVLDNLSGNATLVNRSGVTACAPPLGSPFINLAIGADNALAPNETVRVTLQFTTPSPASTITYSTRVLAGPGTR